MASVRSHVADGWTLAANSQTFQRIALRTHVAVEESRVAAEKLARTAQQKLKEANLPSSTEEAAKVLSRVKEGVAQDIESLTERLKREAAKK